MLDADTLLLSNDIHVHTEEMDGLMDCGEQTLDVGVYGGDTGHWLR